MRLTTLSEGAENAFTLDPEGALDTYEDRDAQRCIVWLARFTPAAELR
ncbi:hypothetical protein [Ruegeria sp. Alg231-54]|nr:hypothetical protein [Ruegeria sp. Alg231-54]